jgi:hypothetical protein
LTTQSYAPILGHSWGQNLVLRPVIDLPVNVPRVRASHTSADLSSDGVADRISHKKRTCMPDERTMFRSDAKARCTRMSE